MGEASLGAPNRLRARYLAVRASALLLALGAGWLTLVIHPEPLFAYSLQRQNVVLHARAPLPAAAAPMLDEVVRRVARSSLYDRGRVQHVFLCDTQALYAVLTAGAPGRGLTVPWGNVLLRPADVARGRVVGRRGEEATGERTLTYFIAHELTHAMTYDARGWRGTRELAPFQAEGYADYVAFSRPVDLAAGRDALRRGDRELDPSRSFLYKRYELLVAFLLERRHVPVDALLTGRRDQREVEAQLQAEPGW